jgi:hypothetical protein
VNVFTKRNAAVGYVTLKAASRMLERRKRRRNDRKLGLYVALGLISLGILAGVVAVLARRRRGASEVAEGASEVAEEAAEVAEEAAEVGADAAAVAEEAASGTENTSEIVGEYVTSPEPIPAT